MKQILTLVILIALIPACTTGGAYRAYPGEQRPAMQVATLEGAQFMRQDWLNRYVDAVRFSQVDDYMIDNSVAFSSIEVEPGYHDVTVYFYWDMGTARGLAPALVSYAASQDTLSRTLRFNAMAGEVYRVMAEPHFDDERQDITTLAYVNFWIEDASGNEIVSRAEGRYQEPGE